MMAMVLVFEKEVLRVTCAHEPLVKRSDFEKDQFCMKMARKWNLQNLVK